MNQFLQLAQKLAQENLMTNAGGPFGACIVKGENVIGQGSNHVLANHDPTAHAEIVAIRSACQRLQTHDLSGCELYTLSFPCPMCLSAIIWSNIKTVYYGNTLADAERIGFRDRDIYRYIHDLSEGKTDVELLDLSEIDHEETRKTFEEFLEKPNRTIY